MRGAYLRALEFKLHQCNTCGISNDGFGDYIYIDIYPNPIKIWNCQPCLDDEKKEKTLV